MADNSTVKPESRELHLFVAGVTLAGRLVNAAPRTAVNGPVPSLGLADKTQEGVPSTVGVGLASTVGEGLASGVGVGVGVGEGVGDASGLGEGVGVPKGTCGVHSISVCVPLSRHPKNSNAPMKTSKTVFFKLLTPATINPRGF